MSNIVPVYKVVLCGRSGVGKTSLMRRCCDNTFQEQCNATIGVDFSLYVTKAVTGETVKLQFWDTAGAERFHAVQSFVWRGAHAIIFVYDITDAKTYDAMSEIVGPALEAVTGIDPWVVVLGNKVDLKEERRVSAKDAAELCASYNYTLMETSAKDNTNIRIMLESLTDTLHSRFGPGQNAKGRTEKSTLPPTLKLPSQQPRTARVEVTPRKATCEC